jgi:hypothetical protein
MMVSKRRAPRRGTLGIRRVKSKSLFVSLRNSRETECFHAIKVGMTHTFVAGLFTPITYVKIIPREILQTKAGRIKVAYHFKAETCNMNRTLVREVRGEGELPIIRFDRSYRVAGVTKGRGTIGSRARFGTKLNKRKHKNTSKVRIGRGHARHPGMSWTVPSAGIMGTMRRTQRNHRFIQGVPVPEIVDGYIYSLNRKRLVRRMPGAGNNLSLKAYPGNGHACSRLGRARIPGRGMIVGGICSARGGRPGHQDPISKRRLKMPFKERVLCRSESWNAWATYGNVYIVDTRQISLNRTGDVVRCVEELLERTAALASANILYASDGASHRVIRSLGSCIDLQAPDLYLLTSYAPGRALFAFTRRPDQLLGSFR